MAHPNSVRDVLGSLTAAGPHGAARPRMTWYGGDGERVELSGRVLATWVSKATNLLVEMTGAGPGTRVLIDLPPHWRAAVWALATWTAGGAVVLETDERADVVVTTAPASFPGHGEVIAVALPALAMAYDGELPPGVTDGAAELMSFGDSPGYLPALDPWAPALLESSEQNDDGVAHDALLGAASDVVAPGALEADARVLLVPRTTREAVLGTLGVLAAGGSVVVAGAELGAQRLEQVASVERARRL